MQRTLLIVLLFLAGCENVVGPWRRPPTRSDDPHLSIAEQEKLGRHNIGLLEESPNVAPNSGIVRPWTSAGR